MKFDKKKLFEGLRKRFAAKSGMDTTQVAVIEAIVDEFVKRKLTDIRWPAYMIATAWGECQWRPVREIGRGKGRPYGKAIKGKVYYGRGLVQLTWLRNYQLMSETTGIDLVANPDRALEIPVAVQIMFEGMTTGRSAKDSFTKYQLQDFFNDKVNDPVNARRIINGKDKADTFAKWHTWALEALEAARLPDDKPVVAPAPVPASNGPDKAAVGTGATVVAAGGAAYGMGFDLKWVAIGGAIVLILALLFLITSKGRKP